MSGLKGFQRTPRAPVRERRNSTSLSSFTQFIGSTEVVQLSGLGELTLRLASDGGLENDAGELTVKLNSTAPGLQLAAAGLSALVQGVLSIDASGIKINLGSGVQNDGGDLAVDESQIQHDSLAGFVADEHVDHAGVSVTTSAPLTGGGDLTASRNLGIDLGAGVELDGSNQLRTTLRDISTKTGNYTATADDETILVDASSAAVTITLPLASSSLGLALNVKKIDASANAVTIDGNGSETIDGATTFDLTSQYDAVTLHCDGSEWWIV